jgi:hypothetical protein
MFLQIAGLSALATQVIIATVSTDSTAAATVGAPETVAIEAKDCREAVWPRIPGHCLERAPARRPLTTIIMSASS